MQKVVKSLQKWLLALFWVQIATWLADTLQQTLDAHSNAQYRCMHKIMPSIEQRNGKIKGSEVQRS
jgi:hypothetical protein